MGVMLPAALEWVFQPQAATYFFTCESFDDYQLATRCVATDYANLTARNGQGPGQQGFHRSICFALTRWSTDSNVQQLLALACKLVVRGRRGDPETYRGAGVSHYTWYTM